MFDFMTPHRLFRTQIHTLRTQLPGVLDGMSNSIHDARVATSRIRELLPLLADARRESQIGDLQLRFKRLGRSLGRVRDADVRVSLLASLETHVPHAAPSLVLLRQEREQERLRLMRKFIKKLERLDAVRLISMLDDHYSVFAHPVPGVRRARHWKRDLRHTLHDRARATIEAVDHATGVYFPARVHEARIAIKKLRYAMEIANETGPGDRSAAIKELKKADACPDRGGHFGPLLPALQQTTLSDQPNLRCCFIALPYPSLSVHTFPLSSLRPARFICRVRRGEIHAWNHSAVRGPPMTVPARDRLIVVVVLALATLVAAKRERERNTGPEVSQFAVGVWGDLSEEPLARVAGVRNLIGESRTLPYASVPLAGNQRWSYRGVTFAIIHRPSGCPTPGDNADETEAAEWMLDTLDDPGSRASAAVMFISPDNDDVCQFDPDGPPLRDSLLEGLENGASDAWISFREEVTKFGKPVVYVDRQLQSEATHQPFHIARLRGLANLTRVAVGGIGAPDEGKRWVHVIVDTRDPRVFSFEARVASPHDFTASSLTATRWSEAR